MAILGRGQLFVALALSVFATSGTAGADQRVEFLNWAHAAPEAVVGFEVHYGTEPGVYSQVVDVGYTFSHELLIDDAQNYYAAIVAYDEVQSSSPSNEIAFLATDPPGGPPLPPETSWSEGFDAAAPGATVPDWLDTGPGSSLIEDDSLFHVVNVGGNQVLTTTSGELDIHSHFVGDAGTTWANYEIRGKLLFSDNAAGIGVTSHSHYPSDDVYFSFLKDPNDQFRLYTHPSGSNCDGASTDVVPIANAWQRFRLNIREFGSVTVVRAKIWADATAEPAAWQVACTDFSDSRPAAGTVGVWSGGSGTKQWDALEVALVPEPAVLHTQLCVLLLLLLLRRLGTSGA